MAGAAAALFFLSRATLARRLNFILKSVKPGGTVLQPTLQIELTAQNPTNSRATLKSLSGSISVNGKFIANVATFGDQVILPRAESVLRITARPTLFGLFDTIRNVLNSRTGANVITVSGTANVDGVSYPFTTQYSI